MPLFKNKRPFSSRIRTDLKDDNWLLPNSQRKILNMWSYYWEKNLWLYKIKITTVPNQLLLNSATCSLSRLLSLDQCCPLTLLRGCQCFQRAFLVSSLSALTRIHQRYIMAWLSTDWLLQTPMRICICWRHFGYRRMTHILFEERERKRRREWNKRGERKAGKHPLLSPPEAKDMLVIGLNCMRRGEISDDSKDRKCVEGKGDGESRWWEKKGWEWWKGRAGGMWRLAAWRKTERGESGGGGVSGRWEWGGMEGHWSTVTTVYRDLTNKHQH